MITPTRERERERERESCRNSALDVIRIFAFICVVSVHFFLNSGFYDEPIAGHTMFLMVCMRNFFMVCVPLFMMLSGYLLKDKTPCRSYYSKIFQTLGIYLLASIACAGYKMITDTESFSLAGSVLGVFGFYTARYSWYVEMYIGLFLLIPFINKMYNGESQRTKKLLITVLLVLTALPSILNIWQLFNPSWWLHPSNSQNYDFIVPDYWLALYPITYYFIGAYLRDHPLKLKRTANLFLIFALFVIAGLFNYYRSYGSTFVDGPWSEYRSVFVTGQSVLIFLYIQGMKLSHLGQKAKTALKKLSSYTLGAYLCSSVFDDLFYGILKQSTPIMQQRLWYFPIMVLLVASCSICLSAILNRFYRLCEKLLQNLLAYHRKKRTTRTTA